MGEAKGDNPACLHTKSSSPDLKTMTPFALGLAEKVSMHHPDTQNKLWHLLLSVLYASHSAGKSVGRTARQGSKPGLGSDVSSYSMSTG